MRHRTRVLSGWTTIVVMSAVLLVSVAVSGQGRGAAPPQGPAAGAPAPQPLPAGTPASQPPPPGAGRQGRGTAPVDRPGPNDKMVVDPAEADAGRTIWTAECVSCHGADARGGNGGPNLVRSVMVLHDRYGSGLGPFLKEGHPMQSGKPSASAHRRPDRAALTLSPSAPDRHASGVADVRRQERAHRGRESRRGLLQWRRQVRDLPLGNRRPGWHRHTSDARRHPAAGPLPFAGGRGRGGRGSRATRRDP